MGAVTDPGTGLSASTQYWIRVTTPRLGVAAGGQHTCARLTDATVRCWGANGLGQPGNDSTTSSPIPVPVSGLGDPGDPDVTAIAAGERHTCALLEDATVRQRLRTTRHRRCN